MGALMIAAWFVAQPGAELDAQIQNIRNRLDALEPIHTSQFGGNLPQQVDMAQAECLVEPGSGRVDSCHVRIAPGEYVTTEPIVLYKRTYLDLYGVRIVPTSTTGIVVERSAAGSVIAGGRLYAIGTDVTTLPRPVGVDIRGSVAVRDLHIERFVRGVQALCGLGTAERLEQHELGFALPPDGSSRGHCNLMRIDNVSVGGSLLDGFYVQGIDANAGVFTGIDAQLNCQRGVQIVGEPDYVDPRNGGRCANIQDRSLLGNTWIAPHSAAARDLIDRPDGAGRWRWWQYLATNPNGRTTWVGAYAEHSGVDHPALNDPSHMRGYGHQVYGGINNIEMQQGLRISEWGRISKAEFSSAQTADGRSSSLCLGRCDQTPSVFTWRVGDADFRGIPLGNGRLRLETGQATNQGEMLEVDVGGIDRGDIKMFRRTLLPACTSTTGVTWSSPSGLVVREDADGMSVCDGSN